MVKRSSCKTDHRITVILYSDNSDNSDSTVLFFSIRNRDLIATVGALVSSFVL